MIRRAAFYAGRTVQILKVSGAGGDHPYMAHVKESRLPEGCVLPGAVMAASRSHRLVSAWGRCLLAALLAASAGLALGQGASPILRG
jgi:hypothetical protein